MSRKNNNAEIWAALSQFGYAYDSTAGSTALSITTATTVGQSALVLSSSGQSTGQYYRVGEKGAFEIVEVETPATGGFTAHSKLAYVHSTGDACMLLLRTNLGDVSDEGLTDEIQADLTQINAATQLGAYDHHLNHTAFRASVSLENLSMENWAFTAGLLESGIHGSGTKADPTVVDFTPNNLNAYFPLFFYARGTLKDGTTAEVQWWDCVLDPTKTTTYARGQDAPLQLAWTAMHKRILHPQ